MKLYLANNEDYIVASSFENASEKYVENRSKDPDSMTLFKSAEFVITESNVVEINTGVLPTAAETDGATVTPTPNVFIKEGDSITLQATPGPTYVNFVNWTDGDNNVLSVDNPFTYTAGALGITISANFSV